jgi:hypothetical protein
MALPRDLLCTFPAVGTILRVIFDQGMQNQYLHLLHSGKWVKFVNILCEVKSGLWLGILTSFTKLRYTPIDDQLISARQRLLLLLWIDTLVYCTNFFFKKMQLIIICVRLYNERLSSERGRIPYWCFPWSRITGFTFVLGLSSINSVIHGPKQCQLCFLEVFDDVCPFPLTEVDYDDVPFVTLMDVLTYSEVSYHFPTVFFFLCFQM